MKRIIAILSLVFPLFPSFVFAQAEEAFIEGLIEQMTVEEKVGQLFMVTFVGDDVGPTSEIAELITLYRVGGVVLLTSNRNFTNRGDTPREVAELTNSLQALAFTVPITSGESLTSTAAITPSTHIPLFIAIDHEGDGYPYTRLINGFTAIPNQMALGATWKEENAERVGKIVGRELAVVGINMLFGPSLDVLDNPRPGLKGDLGTRTFGGDPYWVGKFGKAYIRGVHLGGEGKVVTVAKHFPGHGGSDRRADEEVATVEKSLDELKKIELAPFFAVTSSDDPLAVTEALMTSHIRYRGFQGNIRERTRPISFDPEALEAIMKLPEFEPWREEGGLIVSDALGVRAVRRYYDPQEQTFPHRRIALEALLAGNDVLVLSQFALTDSWSAQLENIKDVILYFREKYMSDTSFQARVDEALRRILVLKHRLYPDFSLEAVQVDVERVSEAVGKGEVLQIAREAITLIHPGPEELADRLPSPPHMEEDILIFTDDREARDCYDCPTYPFIEMDALEKTILRLYGPEGSGQVDPERIRSLTFSQLKALAEKESTEEIETLVKEAEWIIFAMLDLNIEDYPKSDAVKVFLERRPDVLREKKVVVLAYNAPYYLDSTEISKLTAYYGIYSKMQPYIEASARALFGEFQPQGAPPVSVEGINYKLMVQMEPDPEQVIELMLPDFPEEAGEHVIKVGDTIRVRTGVILDRNGHPVPDGTPVEFRFFYPAESVESPPHRVTTINGVAETTISLERTGKLENPWSPLPTE